MKPTLRSVSKSLFYQFYPFLKVVWFVVKYADYFFLSPLLERLPLTTAHRIFRLRWPWPFLLPSEKRLILKNLADTFSDRLPQSQISCIAAGHALFLSCLRFDTRLTPSYSVQELNQGVQFEGISHIDEAQRAGRSVILVGCHSGYIFRGAFALAQKGYKVNVITVNLEHTEHVVWRGRAGRMLFRNFLNSMEKGENLQVLYAGGSLHDEIPGMLQRKEIFATALDNPLSSGDRRGIRVTFLGRRCFFPAQLFQMAKRFNAVCLPYIIRVEGAHCWARVYPPWQPGTKDLANGDDVSAQMMYAFRLFEQHILAFPEQWWLWRDLQAFGVPELGEAAARTGIDIDEVKR